jgi:hypothetical protein
MWWARCSNPVDDRPTAALGRQCRTGRWSLLRCCGEEPIEGSWHCIDEVDDMLPDGQPIARPEIEMLLGVPVLRLPPSPGAGSDDQSRRR